MKYIIKIVVQTLWHDKIKGIILIGCLSLGTLIGTIFVCQANHAFYTYNNLKKNMNLEHFLVVKTTDSNNISPDKISFDFINEIYSFNRIFENIVIHKATSLTGVSIYASDYGFDQCFSKNYPIEGNWIKASNQCVVAYQIQKKYGITQGNSITIGNNNYIVVGSLNMPYYASAIIIPNASINSIKLSQMNLYLKYNRKLTDDNIKELNTYFQKNYNDYSINDEKMIFNYEKNKLYRGWEPTIVISMIALLYGIVNIKNIEKFYFLRRKTTYSILLAYGAMKNHIFLMMYLESGFLSLLSSILTYTYTYLLQYTKLNYVITMRVNLSIFILIILIGQIYSLLSSFTSLHTLYKKNVSEIFRNVI